MLELYPAPTGTPAATDYTMTVNGQALFVYDSGAGAMATFSFDGSVSVTITCERAFSVVAIRPLSRQIAHSVDGRSVTLTLDAPANLSIEFDDDIARPLFLFANPPETDTPAPGDAGVHYFSAGVIHTPGLIELGSNETLYIEGGAIVRANVRASDATNVAIRGRGLLDATNVPDPGHLADFNRCENVSVEGIIAFNSGLWNFMPRWSRNVHFDNVKIVAWYGASDGIDIVSCRDVLIENCFVRNNDDCVAIKAHDGEDVAGVLVERCVFWNGMPGNAMEVGFDLQAGSIRDVTFRDCDVIRVEAGGVLTVHNGDAAIVEDIHFEDIRVEDARETLIDLTVGLSVWSLDCPDERRPRFEDPDYVWAGSWLLPAEDAMAGYAAGRGQIRNITFRDIDVLGDQVPPSLFLSYDADHGVSDVTIENLRIADEPITSIEAGGFLLRDPEGTPTPTDPATIRFLDAD